MANRVSIELHGENSGLLDRITADSMEGVRSLLIRKLEAGKWNFHPGDTLKVVSDADRYRYAVAVPQRGIDKTTRAYTKSYNEVDGNWTDIIMGDDGDYRPFRFHRLPKFWKTRAGAEKAAAGIYSKHNLVVVRVMVEGAI